MNDSDSDCGWICDETILVYKEAIKYMDMYPEHIDIAVRMLLLVMKDNHPDALMRLENIASRLEMAAKANYADAQYAMSLLYEHGVVFPKSAHQQKIWLDRALENNCPGALFSLWEKDPETPEGAANLLKAAELGFGEAEAILSRQAALKSDCNAMMYWGLRASQHGFKFFTTRVPRRGVRNQRAHDSDDVHDAD